MEYLIVLLALLVGAPSLFALFRLIQRKRNYARAMRHWDNLQRRVDDELPH